MHIELKVPRDENVKNRYNYQRAVSCLHKLIEDYDMAEFCMIQSFDHDTLREFEKQNKQYQN